MTTITDRRMPRGRAISVLSLAVWWAELEKKFNDNVRHIMTQIANLLVVATVFTWLIICNVCILQSERGDLYTRHYIGTWTKNAGGLMHKGGGGNRGILR